MKKIILIATVLISIVALSVSIFLYANQKKIAYVDNGKLYDEFTLKKEYEKQINGIRISRKNMLDSIEMGVKQLEAGKFFDEARYAKEIYMEKLRQFEDEEESLLQEYNVQIWKRLNQYAVDFAKEKNIDLLFGASGNGTLLHADAELDLTKEMIVYANKKYDGK